jgi:RNA-directed DNA polymerase
VKTITRKTTPSSFDERIQKLKETSQGWLNYFRMASIQGKLKELDGWLLNRLRYCIWHYWNRAIGELTTIGSKKPERKRKNLIRLGVEQEMAYQWSRSRMGGWAIAQSPILGITITLERLRKRGYESLFSYYEKIAPS